MAAEQQTADDGAPLNDLTGFQRDVLSTVASLEEIGGQSPQQPNGIEIKEALAESYDERVNHGRLYQNLRQLVEDGFVEKGELTGRTNFYHLSEHARAALWDHLTWQQEALEA